MFNLLTIINVPTISSLFTSTSAWATGMFDELIPVVLAIGGLIVGGLLVRAFFKGILNAVRSVFGRGRRGGRRRRRR